jgi:hypothetical protein
MSPPIIRLRAQIDQARASLRDRIVDAGLGIGPAAAAEADQVVDRYFVPLLERATTDELTAYFAPEFESFLVACGLVLWAELEAERIEAQMATS